MLGWGASYIKGLKVHDLYDLGAASDGDFICIWFYYVLTLQVLKTEYSGMTRSISWLPMPWLLASPGHQQPWYMYWLCRINCSLSFRKRITTYSCHHIVEKLYKMKTCFQNRFSSVRINSLWPGDAIWRHRSRSTLVQVMACCLTAPSHYLHQCWLIISEV